MLEVALVLLTIAAAVRFWATRNVFELVMALATAVLAGLALLTTHRLNVLQSPRTLTSRDVERFRQQLSDIPPVTLEVTSPGGDTEACTFADEIAHILNSLEWCAQRTQQMGARRFPRHIEVVVRDLTQTPVQAGPLLTAIQALGFPTSPIRENRNSPFALELAIGHK